MIESPLIEELLAYPEVIRASPVHQQTLLDTLLRVLVARFQSIPEELRTTVSAMRAPERLTGLIEWAAVCKSLEEFQSRLTP